LRNPLQIFGETTATTTIVVGERKKEERRTDIGQEDPAETNASDESAGVEDMPTLPHSTKQHGRGETKEKGRGGRQKHTNQSPSSYLQGVKKICGSKML
jgi:hypothetical protein